MIAMFSHVLELIDYFDAIISMVDPKYLEA